MLSKFLMHKVLKDFLNYFTQYKVIFSCLNHSNLQKKITELLSFKLPEPDKFILLFLVSVSLKHIIKCKKNAKLLKISKIGCQFFFTILRPLRSKIALTILTSSILEKLRTNMLTWTSVAESENEQKIRSWVPVKISSDK